MPIYQVKAIALGKNVNGYAEDRHGLLFILGSIGMGNIPAIHNINCTGADSSRFTVSLEHQSGILIDSDAEQAGILGDRTQQASHAAPLGKVLVNNDSREQAQP